MTLHIKPWTSPQVSARKMTGPLFRTIREQLIEAIRADVLSQRLAAGTSLREESLARQYGVSRAPIRDALLQLTNEGLLVAKPNCGVKVAALPDESLQPLVIELRRKIEVFALDHLLDRRANVDFAPLRRIVAELKAACEAGDMSAVVNCDMAFHRFIIEAADQQDLLALWLPIVSRMMLHYTRHKDWMESHREHATIADAIQRGARQKATKLLTDNIR